MCRAVLALALCAAPLLAQWTTADTAWEVAAEIGISQEWAQMQASTEDAEYRNRPGHCIPWCNRSVDGIDRKILGAHPRMRNTNLYFAGWLLAHPLISYALPAPYRRVWQTGTVVFEVVVLPCNYSGGCRIVW